MDAENSLSADVNGLDESDVLTERNVDAGDNKFSEEKRAGVSGEFSKIGFYHTPKQSSSLAGNLMLPMDTTDHLEDWLGKCLDLSKAYCLDLSKAYKQMGVSPAHRHLAVIFLHNREGNPGFCVANSLMFGATSAVYSFNRVSRSIWYLLNRMLVIPCGVF